MKPQFKWTNVCPDTIQKAKGILVQWPVRLGVKILPLAFALRGWGQITIKMPQRNILRQNLSFKMIWYHATLVMQVRSLLGHVGICSVYTRPEYCGPNIGDRNSRMQFQFILKQAQSVYFQLQDFRNSKDGVSPTSHTFRLKQF